MAVDKSADEAKKQSSLEGRAGEELKHFFITPQSNGIDLIDLLNRQLNTTTISYYNYFKLLKYFMFAFGIKNCRINKKNSGVPT
ncbi:MAG: hypothetical protein R2941_13945 [Desulfobacterales bacterium]